jgi:hypothetical protein
MQMRTLITSLVCAATVVTGAGVAGAAPDEGHTHEGAHAAHGARDYESLWDAASLKERTAAGDLIVETDEAAERWHDVDTAITDGFVPNRGGVGVVHYRNVANRRDTRTLDPDHPEALVYFQRPASEPMLLGAVYVTRRDQERVVPAGDLAAWHVHDAAGCRHPDVDVGCEAVQGGMLHVWLYDGVVDPFADPAGASMGGRAQWRAKLGELAALS